MMATVAFIPLTWFRTDESRLGLCERVTGGKRSGFHGRIFFSRVDEEGW